MCRKDLNNNNTYDIVEKAVKHYQKNYNEYLGTKLTISPENLPFLFDGIKNFIDLDFKGIHFNPVYEDVWKIEDSTKYYYELKKIIDYVLENDLEDRIFLSQIDSPCGEKAYDNKNWCGGTGNNMIAVAPNGKIYSCIRYMPSSLGNNQVPFSLGNVNDGIGYDDITLKRIELLNSITKES